MARSKHTQESEKEPSFEEGLEQLENIVKDMEAGELSLSDTLGKYEQGVKLAKSLKGMLDLSEKQLTILKTKSDGEDSNTPHEES